MRTLIIIALFGLFFQNHTAMAQFDLNLLKGKSTYKRAVDDKENVKNKLFPKINKLEFSGPSLGLILNQSYLTSFLVHASTTYWFAEDWGITGELLYSINSDKAERYCIEHFYNDYQNQVAAACPRPEEDKTIHLFDSNGNAIRGANFGPAYVAIRELNYLITGAATWAPIYGKQLAFMAGTVYFDIYLTIGGGVAISTYYPKSDTLRNGTVSRGEVTTEIPRGGCPEGAGIPGACPSNPEIDSLVGFNGRPDPEQQITPTMTFGIGQKFHFFKNWHFKTEIRNYSLIATEAGFEPSFMLWAGFGVRI